MHLDMTERQIGAVTVLDLAGKLTKTTGGLVTLFDTFDSEDEAVRSFHQLPAGSPIASLAE